VKNSVQSSVTEHVFSSIKKLTTNGTGNRVVVRFLVAFLVIETAEFFSADIAGMGLI
jgi:tRNA A22 N-methylase